MEFKYAKEHSQLSCVCPPNDELTQEDIIGYRLVHEVEHLYDVIPPNIIIPSRIHGNEDCKTKCSNYALSFFVSREKAIKQLQRLHSRIPLIVDTIGDYIAECKLLVDDGKISKPSKRSGHFNLYEFKDVDLELRLTDRRKVVL